MIDKSTDHVNDVMVARGNFRFFSFLRVLNEPSAEMHVKNKKFLLATVVERKILIADTILVPFNYLTDLMVH